MERRLFLGNGFWMVLDMGSVWIDSREIGLLGVEDKKREGGETVVVEEERSFGWKRGRHWRRKRESNTSFTKKILSVILLYIQCRMEW